MLMTMTPANQPFKVCEDLLAFTAVQIEWAPKNQEEWVLLSYNFQQFHPHLISKRMCKLLSSKHPTPFHSDTQFLSFVFFLWCATTYSALNALEIISRETARSRKEIKLELFINTTCMCGGANRGRLKKRRGGGTETGRKWGGVMTGKNEWMPKKKKKKEMRKVEDRCRKEKKRWLNSVSWMSYETGLHSFLLVIADLIRSRTASSPCPAPQLPAACLCCCLPASSLSQQNLPNAILHSIATRTKNALIQGSLSLEVLWGFPTCFSLAVPLCPLNHNKKTHTHTWLHKAGGV